MKGSHWLQSDRGHGEKDFYWLCDVDQGTSPPCTSISSSVKWDNSVYLRRNEVIWKNLVPLEDSKDDSSYYNDDLLCTSPMTLVHLHFYNGCLFTLLISSERFHIL